VLAGTKRWNGSKKSLRLKACGKSPYTEWDREKTGAKLGK